MEDDEDVICSRPSLTPSPSPPQSPSPLRTASSGRITVTLPNSSSASQQQSPQQPSQSPPLPQQPPLHVLALALPSQNPRHAGLNCSGSGGGGGGREDCWSEGATEVLIDAWGERYLELSRGNLRQQHWKEVADIVCSRDDFSKTPKTDVQCKNRIDTVKKKYKLEKARIAAGGGPSNWKFFEKLDRLIGPNTKYSGDNSPNMGIKSQSQSKQQKIGEKAQKGLKGQRRKIKNRGWMDSDSETDGAGSEEEEEEDSMDSLPPTEVKRSEAEAKKNERGGIERGSNVAKELTRAIETFGKVYEMMETAKVKEAVEMEKQRMIFAKEMEVKRMQFFMKTQVKITQMMKYERKVKKEADVGGGGGGKGVDHYDHCKIGGNVVEDSGV